jgi:hypothetical protein
MTDILTWVSLVLVLCLLGVRVHPRAQAWAPRGALRSPARSPGDRAGSALDDVPRRPIGTLPLPRPADHDRGFRLPVGSIDR